MGQELIYVHDMTNPGSILAAFQRALDAVVNKDAISARMRDFNNKDCQYVHANRNAPAVGYASTVINWGTPNAVSSIYVVMYAPGSGVPHSVYVPKRLVDALAVRLNGTPYVTSFQRHEGSGSRATLRVPTQELLAHPHAIIGFKK